MKIHTLLREQLLPITITEAWDFFSSAKNLSKITPPEMRFVILTDLKKEPVYAGMKIDYTVRPLFGIPLHWTTEIVKVKAPVSFTDRQTKGPYALWEHTHIFEEVPNGVKMTDSLKYALPLGILGDIAYAVVVGRKVKEIFDYREKALVNLFGGVIN